MDKTFLQVKQDLEAYYKESYEEYSLEERDYIVSLYDVNIQFLLHQMSEYEFWVKFALEHQFSVSIISRLTHNLIIVMAHVYAYTKPYNKVIRNFLMDERYEKNYKYWEDFSITSESIRNYISHMLFNNTFEIDNIKSDNYLENLHIKTGFGGDIPPLINFEKRLAHMNGSDLLKCLEYMINILNTELTNLKNIGLMEDDSIYEKLFDLNFKLYAKVYWPDKKANFRLHINKILRNNIEIDDLKKERRQLIRDFESNPPGKIWKDYSEDKVRMALEMKHKALDTEQWLYFFENYFKIEDLDSWIDEIEHPIKADKVYPISKWDKIFNDAIDVEKVKKDIDLLLSGDFSKTNCFVLHKILCEIDWLQDEIATHFISWIDDIYGWDASAKDFKSIHPNLKNQHSLDWDLRTMTSGKISKDYINLADNIRNKFVKKMEGKNVIEENKFYFIKPELYIKHKVWP